MNKITLNSVKRQNSLLRRVLAKGLEGIKLHETSKGRLGHKLFRGSGSLIADICGPLQEKSLYFRKNYFHFNSTLSDTMQNNYFWTDLR